MKLVSSLVCVLVAVSPLLAVGPVPRIHTVHHTPHHVGDEWIAGYPFDDGSKREVKYSVTEVEPRGVGHLLITIDRRSVIPEGLLIINGKKSPAEVIHTMDRRVMSGPSGVELVEDFDPVTGKWVKIDPPRKICWWPMKAKDKWKVSQEDFTIWLEVGEKERVTVPAGVFDAIVLNSITHIEGQTDPIRRRFWYVAGFGVVKSSMDDKVQMELVSFTPAKKK